MSIETAILVAVAAFLGGTVSSIARGVLAARRRDKRDPDYNIAMMALNESGSTKSELRDLQERIHNMERDATGETIKAVTARCREDIRKMRVELEDDYGLKQIMHRLAAMEKVIDEFVIGQMDEVSPAAEEYRRGRTIKAMKAERQNGKGEQ